MRLLCRASRWLRTVVYFFNNDCRSACSSRQSLFYEPEPVTDVKYPRLRGVSCLFEIRSGIASHLRWMRRKHQVYGLVADSLIDSLWRRLLLQYQLFE